jgi:hypothetical protein
MMRTEATDRPFIGEKREPHININVNDRARSVKNVERLKSLEKTFHWALHVDEAAEATLISQCVCINTTSGDWLIKANYR